MVVQFLIFLWTFMLCSIVPTPFHFPKNIAQEFQYLHSQPFLFFLFNKETSILKGKL